MRNPEASDAETYLRELFPKPPSELIAHSRAESARLGKAGISLSDGEGRLVSALIRSHGCKKFIEIGTLTGSSALWILEALPNSGHLWTFEKDPGHAQSASKTLAKYKERHPEKNFSLIEGDAAETLQSIEAMGPFDGIFIDGNKSAYLEYLSWAERNLRPGGLILADNIFLGGSVITGVAERFSKKQIEVMRAFNRRLADPQHFVSAVIPTGEGLFFAIKIT